LATFREIKLIKYVTFLFISLALMSTRAQNVENKAETGCAVGTLNAESPETAKSLSAFLEAIKAALSSNDKQKLAGMSAYPLSVGTVGGEFTIRSPEEFARRYKQIFPKSLVDFLESQQPQCISRVGAKGFTVGHGEIWFDQYPSGKVKFFSINPVVSPTSPRN
jgi:hypothetical protein